MKRQTRRTGENVNKRQIAAITVVFSDKDGIVHAYSPQLPGLHVCGKTRASVFSDTPAVIQKLYKLKHGRDVVVTLSPSPDFTPGRVPSRETKVANYLAEAQPA